MSKKRSNKDNVVSIVEYKKSIIRELSEETMKEGAIIIPKNFNDLSNEELNTYLPEQCKDLTKDEISALIPNELLTEDILKESDFIKIFLEPEMDQFIFQLDPGLEFDPETLQEQFIPIIYSEGDIATTHILNAELELENKILIDELEAQIEKTFDLENKVSDLEERMDNLEKIVKKEDKDDVKE